MRQEPDDEDPTGRRFSADVARLRGRRARRVCYIEYAIIKQRNRDEAHQPEGCLQLQLQENRGYLQHATGA